MSNYKRFKFYLLIVRLRLGVYSSDTVDLKGYDLTTEDVELLISSIQSNSKMNAQIKVIDLSNNDIRKVDISGLLGLVVLKISGSKLEELYLSRLPCLRELDASFNNIIARYNISKITSLTRLNLKGNHIPAVQVNMNENLQELNLTANPIKTMDLSGLPQLTNVDLTLCPLQTLIIGDLPATANIALHGHKLDEISTIELISRQNLNPTTTKVQGRRNRVMTLTDAFVITTDHLEAYFAKIIHSYKYSSNAQNALFESQRIYAYLQVAKPQALCRDVALIIAIDKFYAHLQQHLQMIINSLLTTCSTEVKPERSALLKQFMQNILKNSPILSSLTKETCVAASKIVLNKAVAQTVVGWIKPKPQVTETSQNPLVWAAKRLISNAPSFSSPIIQQSLTQSKVSPT